MSPDVVLQGHPAATVRWLRGRLGLTQAAFGARFGVSANVVANWEAGRQRIGLAAHRRIVPTLARHLPTSEGVAFVKALAEPKEGGR